MQDLAVASPATVSRLGMVYVDGEVLGWETPLKSFLANPFAAGGLPDEIPNEHRESIETMFLTYVPKALRAVIALASMLCSQPWCGYRCAMA